MLLCFMYFEIMGNFFFGKLYLNENGFRLVVKKEEMIKGINCS